MLIHQETVDRVYDVVKGFRTGDQVSSKTIAGAVPYQSVMEKRGFIVRFDRGKYRVIRPMSPDDIRSAIELYNLAQNNRRSVAIRVARPVRTGKRLRSTRAEMVDSVYEKVKELRNGDRVLVGSLTKSHTAHKRLYKHKILLRGASKSDGCTWNGGAISKEDLAAILFGKRRPNKRRSDVAKANIKTKSSLRPVVDAALEVMDEVLKPSKNGHADAPLTIESNGFRITLSKGSIIIS